MDDPKLTWKVKPKLRSNARALRKDSTDAKGFHVLRFGNHDVMRNRTGVLETIASVLASRAPTPTLPRKRERGQAAAAATLSINET